MAISLGLSAKAYLYGVADPRPAFSGLTLPGDLDELTNVTDVTLNLSKATADITTRAAAGWRAEVGTLKEGEISFDMLWDDADTNFTTIFDAWNNNTHIGAAFLSGGAAVPGTSGLWADFTVAQFEKSEALEEAQRVSVTLRITLVTGNAAPEWVNVT